MSAIKAMHKSILIGCLAVVSILTVVSIASALQLELKSHYPFGPPYDVVAEDGFLYIGTGCEVRVWDISDESDITKLNWNNSIAKIYTRSLVMGLYIKKNYLYIAAQKHFVIADVSNPYSPRIVGILENPNPTYDFKDVEVKDNYAYLTGKVVYVVDISDKSNPRIVGQISVDGSWRLNVSGDKLYVATKKAKLYIVNISDPTNPKIEGIWSPNWTSGTSMSSVAVKGNYAYVIRYHYGLYVVDVSDPTQPKEVANITAYPKQTYNYNDIKIVGNYAYVSVRYKGIDVIDISDPTHPVVIGSCKGFPAYAEGIFTYVAPSGKCYTFLAGHSIGVAIYDTTDPSNPVMINRFHTLGGAKGLAIKDGYLFVGAHNDGVWVVDVNNPDQPNDVAYVYLSGRFGDVAVQGDYLYAAGVWGLLSVIDVSNPEKPVVVAESVGKPTAKPVLVDGNYLYAMWSITDDHILVYNITDPKNPVLHYDFDMSSYLGRIYDFAKFVEDGREYLLVASDTGLYVVDVTDKSNFAVVGTWSNGKEIKGVDIVDGNKAVVIYHGGLSIIDLSNVNNPAEVGSLALPGMSPEALLVFSNYAFIGAFDKILVVDLSDLANPKLVQELELPGGRVHELVTDGTYLYASAVYYGVYILQMEGLPLTIYDVKITNIDQNEATITWKTNYESDSLVKYGTSPGNYTMQAYDSKLTRTHTITLKGLEPDTTYYFKIVSKTSTDVAESDEYCFRTKVADLTPPKVTIVYPENNSVLLGGIKTVKITIRTDEPAYCQYSFHDFEYGEGTNFTYGQGDTIHSFDLNVEDGRTYVLYYRCIDRYGNKGESVVHVFKVATKWWDDFSDSSRIDSMENVEIANGARLKIPSEKVYPTKDAQISPVKDWSNGDKPKLSVGSCDRYRAVFEFKLPEGTGDIGTVKLWLYDCKSSDYDEENVLDLYLLEGTFDERTVNWTHRDSNTEWSNPGGDYSTLIDHVVLEAGKDYSGKWICFTLKGSNADNSIDIEWGATIRLLLKMRYGGGMDYRSEQFYSKESEYKPYIEVLPKEVRGVIVSKPITPTSIVSWGKFYANYSLPEGTSITFSIIDAQTGKVLCSGLTGNGDDISNINAKSIRLKAELISYNPPKSPVLYSWSVSWKTYKS